MRVLWLAHGFSIDVTNEADFTMRLGLAFRRSQAGGGDD